MNISFPKTKESVTNWKHPISAEERAPGYVPVEYPPTSEIMANLRELEKQIAVEMDELEKLLKE